MTVKKHQDFERKFKIIKDSAHHSFKLILLLTSFILIVYLDFVNEFKTYKSYSCFLQKKTFFYNNYNVNLKIRAYFSNKFSYLYIYNDLILI